MCVCVGLSPADVCVADVQLTVRFGHTAGSVRAHLCVTVKERLFNSPLDAKCLRCSSTRRSEKQTEKETESESEG